MATGNQSKVDGTPGVDEIVRAAIRSLPAFLGGRQAEGVRVEEVFPPKGRAPWRITLSHLEPAEPESAMANALLGSLPDIWKPTPRMERVLRVLEVDPASGAPLSMRSREDLR